MTALLVAIDLALAVAVILLCMQSERTSIALRLFARGLIDKSDLGN